MKSTYASLLQIRSGICLPEVMEIERGTFDDIIAKKIKFVTVFGLTVSGLSVSAFVPYVHLLFSNVLDACVILVLVLVLVLA